jgi:hypothetical protein
MSQPLPVFVNQHRQLLPILAFCAKNRYRQVLDLSTIMDRHLTAVGAIAERMKHFHHHKIPFRIYHGSTNSTGPSPYQVDRMIYTLILRRLTRFPDPKTLIF